jgi:hypothetical protein
VVVAILSPLSLYGGYRKTKLPLLHNTRIHAPEGHFGILVVAPSDGCSATATRLASTQALRSRCVSSASKSLDALGSRLRLPSLGSWLCGSTKQPRRFCGELPQTPQIRCSLHAYPTHDLAATSSRLDLGFEAQPRNRTRLRLAFLATMRPALDLVWPPGPSSRAYLFLHSSEATQPKTFRARSSPAPMQIKPQPAHATLDQESVHTTLSITHHTKERPSTGHRMLQSSTPGMSASFQAKMSRLARRKLTSASSYFGSRPAPIKVVLLLSPVSRSIALTCT